MRKYLLAHPWVLLLSALTGGLLQGVGVLSHLITRDIVDAMVEGNRDAFFSYMWRAALVVAAMYLLTIISVRMFMAYMDKSKRTLERDFFDAVLGMRVADFQRGSSAKYISVLNNDISTIAQQYFQSAAQFTKDFISVLMAVAVMAVISPVNAVIAVATALLPLVAPILYGDRLAQRQLESSTYAMAFNRKVKDYLTGFEVIKTFRAEANIATRFYDAATQWMRARYRSGAAVADMSGVTIAIVVATVFLNYFVAGWFVLSGAITVGGVVAIVALSASIVQPMTLVANHISSIRSSKKIAQRVLDMMAQKDTRERAVQIADLTAGITLKNVSFAYDESEEKSPAVRNVSYHFKQGRKYAIVGASGSGKSTLAKLVMGYFDNYEGNLTIGSQEVREINRADLYQKLSTLSQEVFLLDDTLRNNITLYNTYTDDAYNRAVTQANLCSVVDALPNGADTALGEGGNTLSGGERQRVAIARALLKGSEILVLDEATASLDNEVAHEIESAIINMAELTCLFVTHRYNEEILRQCDGILVMKDGELVAQGTYDTLNYFK